MESDKDLGLSFFNIDIGKYSVLLTVFVLLIMLVLFLRKKIRGYLNHRDKLVHMADDYERRRNCRNDLRVRKAYLYLVSLRLGFG